MPSPIARSRNRSFPERELKRVALLHGLGSVTPEQVAAELPRQGVITAEIDGRLMATTDELQAEERFISGFAAAGRGTVVPGRRACGAGSQAGRWQSPQ